MEGSEAFLSYQGAKNLMKTDFPAVAVSKLSGVRTVTSAAAKERMERTVAMESFMLSID